MEERWKEGEEERKGEMETENGYFKSSFPTA
jgi:hypothetical protein